MSTPYNANESVIKQSLWEGFRQDWVWWALAGVLSFFFASWLMGGGKSWLPNLLYPYTYGGDSFSYQLNIMRNIEAPWYYFSERMGYPFGSVFLDYPASDNGSYAVVKVLGWLFGTSTAAYNLYFLLSFPVVTVATYVVSRSLGLSKPFSVAVALLYCFIPFHIGRIGHLFFTWYFVVPIYLYYGFRLVSHQVPFLQAGQPLWQRLLDGLMFIVLASFGVYYAVFACIVLGTAGLMGSVARASLKPFLASVMAIGFVVAGVLANVAPSILHAQEHGKNLAAVGRLPLETDLYGLKIAQLMIPQEDHRSESKREFATYYRNSFLLVNENVSASLGLIGSVGFLGLLAALFLTPLGMGTRGRLLDRRLSTMAVLSMALVVVSTIGGLATFFAIFISPAIRSWNRTSIFIGFLSLAGLALMVQLVLEKLNQSRLILLISAVIALVATYVGVRDQTAKPCKTCAANVQSMVQADKAFAAAIEKQLGSGAAVYQLPYISYPDTAPVGVMDTYAHMRLILNAPHLKFSYGGMMWRDGDWFYRMLAKRPMADQIAVVRLLGMTGVTLNRLGYFAQDESLKPPAMVDRSAPVKQEVAAFAKSTPPLQSPDGEVTFYHLDTLNPEAAQTEKQRALAVLADMGYALKDGKPQAIDDQFFDKADLRLPDLPKQYKEAKGLDIPGVHGRWMNADLVPTAIISFVKPLPAKFKLVLRGHALGPNVGQPLQIRVGGQTRSVTFDAAIESRSVEFELGKRVAAIELIPFKPVPANSVVPGPDARRLSVELESIAIEKLP
jgi:phosphoglycerol transferase